MAGPLPVGALLHAELPAGVWLLSVLPSPPRIRKASRAERRSDEWMTDEEKLR